jgi:hypothetical protein
MAGKGQIMIRVRKTIIERGRPRKHHKGTSEQILCNFRLRMREPHSFQGNPEGVT